MDLEIDMECRECGWLYRQNFRDMRHGKSLKCPFCFSSNLSLNEGVLVEARKEPDGFERSLEERTPDRKIKVN